MHIQLDLGIPLLEFWPTGIIIHIHKDVCTRVAIQHGDNKLLETKKFSRRTHQKIVKLINITWLLKCTDRELSLRYITWWKRNVNSNINCVKKDHLCMYPIVWAKNTFESCGCSCSYYHSEGWVAREIPGLLHHGKYRRSEWQGGYHGMTSTEGEDMLPHRCQWRDREGSEFWQTA